MTKFLIKPANYLYSAIAFFLCSNVIVRFYTIFNYNAVTAVVSILSALCCGLIILYPIHLRQILFVFGAIFILYGFHSYSIYNQVFELLLTFLSLTLLCLNIRQGGFLRINRQLPTLLLLYTGLSIFSILSMPIGNISKTLSLWGVYDFADVVFLASPDSYLYPIAAINRAILFFIFAVLIATLHDAKETYKSLFMGILFGY